MSVHAEFQKKKKRRLCTGRLSVGQGEVHVEDDDDGGVRGAKELAAHVPLDTGHDV